MRRMWAVLLFVVVLISFTGDAYALLAGSYRCTGSVDNANFFLTVIHYNPNAANKQVITRVRAFSSLGGKYHDDAPSQDVPARGSFPIVVPAPGGFDDVQVLVDWTQPQDTAAPIPRVEFLLTNATGDTISISRANCP